MAFEQNTYTGFLANTSVLGLNDQYETRMINDDSGNILYIGKTLKPSGTTSSAIWDIKKLSYDDNGYLNYVQLPNSGPGFYYIWDDVTTYF
jgi:hypothetical protein